MRFIGCKGRLLGLIDQFFAGHGIKGHTLFDMFSGTASVGKYFKEKGYRIVSSDTLHFSYVLQIAYIKCNAYPVFKGLEDIVEPGRKATLVPGDDTPLVAVVSHLNQVAGEKGFIYGNYSYEGTKDGGPPRMYFRGKNACKIDGIRNQIEAWRDRGLVTDIEYYILIASLVEAVPFVSNISGVYAAHLKCWDPRAEKVLSLVPPRLIRSELNHEVYNVDSLELLPRIKCDILYLDPPYNERQYIANYHILETISRWDQPELHGRTGMRPYAAEKSVFCNRGTAAEALSRVAREGQYRHLVLSYNSEGILTDEDIMGALTPVGHVVKTSLKYRRFKSNSSGERAGDRHIQELLYYVRKAR